MYPWGHISILVLILEGLKSPMKHKLNRQTNFWDKSLKDISPVFLYCHHVPGTLSLMELAVPLCCPVTVGFCGSYSLSNFLSSTSWLSCTNPGVSLGFIQKNRTYPSHLKRWDCLQIGSLVYCCRRKEPHTYRGWNCAGYSNIFLFLKIHEEWPGLVRGHKGQIYLQETWVLEGYMPVY